SYVPSLHDHGVVEPGLRVGLKDALHRAALAVAVDEGLGPSPGNEGVAGLPDGMGDVLALRVTLQQRELDEAGDLAGVRLAVAPALLEDGLLAGNDLEVVHGDEHRLPPLVPRDQYARLLEGEAVAGQEQHLPQRAAAVDAAG